MGLLLRPEIFKCSIKEPRSYQDTKRFDNGYGEGDMTVSSESAICIIFVTVFLAPGRVPGVYAAGV